MATGAPILEKTSNQTANHILNEALKVKRENLKKAQRDITHYWRTGQEVPDYLLDNMVTWGVTGRGLRARMKRAHLDPALRRLVETELAEKIRALEVFEGIPGR